LAIRLKKKAKKIPNFSSAKAKFGIFPVKMLPL